MHNDALKALRDDPIAIHEEIQHLEKNPYLDNVHTDNELAYKGDDSDGKIEWTIRTMIAATALGFLYTGKNGFITVEWY